MLLTIIVKPNSKREFIEKISETEYRIAVRAPAVEGKANEAVLEAIAEYFHVRKSAILIKSGKNGRKKIVEIDH